MFDRHVDAAATADVLRECHICLNTSEAGNADVVFCLLCGGTYHWECQALTGTLPDARAALNKTPLIGNWDRVMRGMSALDWLSHDMECFCGWCGDLLRNSRVQ